MKFALAISLTMFFVAYSTGSNEPSYVSKAGGKLAPPLEKTTDDYFSNAAYCERGSLKVGGVQCNVDYRHAFTKLGQDLYLAQVGVLQGCNGRSAADISRELARLGNYRLDFNNPAVAMMTRISNGKTYAVIVRLLSHGFTLQAAGDSSTTTFRKCD